MPETADNWQDYSISREECDAFAARSHHNAQAAWDNGVFAEEVIPIEVKQKKDTLIFQKMKAFAQIPVLKV